MKNIGLIIGALLVIGGGAGVILSMSSDDNPSNSAATAPTQSVTNQESEETEEATDPQDTIQTSVQTAEGVYTDYSEEAVSKYKGKMKVVFFHADWCPQCQGLERNIQAGSIPEDIVIFKTDYDNNQQLRQKYGVTNQTTLVQIDDNGDKLKLWIGSAFTDIDDIQAELI